MATAIEYAANTYPNYFPGGATHPNAQQYWDTLPQYIRDDATTNATGGATGGSTDYSPSGLSSVFRQPAVTLPGAAGAKDTLRASQMGATRGLDALIAKDPTAEREALRKAIYDPTAADINYQADRTRQSGLEMFNSKNMLASSPMGDYVIEPTERARGASLSKAGNDAFMSANTAANQNTATQAQVLGQAFNQGTTGLQADANVENAQASRDQSATQAGYQTGLQRMENESNRQQQATLQRESFSNAKDIAGSNALAGGIAGGLGGLAQIFGPSLNKGVQSLFGVTS